MAKKKINNSGDNLVIKTRPVLTGNPREDFAAWLKSTEKDYDQGIELIEKYTQNHTLLKFLRDNRSKETVKKVMIENIKIIALKWKM